MAISYCDDPAALEPSQLEGFFVGWPTPPDPERHLAILRGSHKVWLAMDGARCVGFLNAISDGGYSALLPLLEVLPAYRGRGIGAELVRRMVASLEGHYGIDVVCDPGVAGFYDALGFTRLVALAKRDPVRQDAGSSRGGAPGGPDPGSDARAHPMEEHLERFADAAAGYCAWVESAPGSAEDEAHAAVRHLASLHLLALDLGEPEGAPDVEAEGLTQAAWRAAYERFAALPFNAYASVFDPRSAETGQGELEVGDLADDLADTYRDLHDGLTLLRAGHPQAAEWQWCWSFRNHWGRHLTGALHALHCWCADEGAW